jgi:hypothetical protein
MAYLWHMSGAGALWGDRGWNNASFDADPSAPSFHRYRLEGPCVVPLVTLCYLLSLFSRHSLPCRSRNREKGREEKRQGIGEPPILTCHRLPLIVPRFDDVSLQNKHLASLRAKGLFFYLEGCRVLVDHSVPWLGPMTWSHSPPAQF